MNTITTSTVAVSIVEDEQQEQQEQQQQPTVAWIVEMITPSKLAMTAYFCFVIDYQKKNQGEWPPIGVWDQQNKDFWNSLATQVNRVTKYTRLPGGEKWVEPFRPTVVATESEE